MVAIKAVKVGGSIYLNIPSEVCSAYNIGQGSMFDMSIDGYGRFTFQKVQIVTPAPDGSVWTLQSENTRRVMEDGEPHSKVISVKQYQGMKNK